MNKYELYEVLRSLDEVTLLELLEVNSSDLIDKFYDRVDDNIDKFYRLAYNDEEAENKEN